MVTFLVLLRPPPKALPSMSFRLTMPMLAPGMPGISKVGMPRAGVAQLELDLVVVELARAQHAAELGPGVGAGALAHQRVEHALLGGELGLGRDLLAQPLAGHADGDLHEIADDLLDIAADIADLGEFGRLDLEEGRLGQLARRRAISVLPTPVGPDHQDVLGQHLLAQLLGQLLAAPAVAQRDGDGALGLVLADDVAVELGDDLARGEALGRRLDLRGLRLVGGGSVVHRLSPIIGSRA